MEPPANKVLVFGAKSFTGRYLLPRLRALGYQVYGTSLTSEAGSGLHRCDITQEHEVRDLVYTVYPDYIVHLAGISFITYAHSPDLYRANLFGGQNVLEACRKVGLSPRKIIMASSGAVYGQREGHLDESLCPAPVSHYALSKLCLEHVAATYFSDQHIVLTRPFNYTGPGQSKHFVIPKIVEHFRRGDQRIELGNIDVIREFNDVRMIVDLYARLLQSKAQSMVVNLCSGRGYSLRQILETMQDLTGNALEVLQNKELLRPNEMHTLIGDTDRLKRWVGPFDIYPLRVTLADMLERG